MGLALAWPDLAHRRLHEDGEHHHEHPGHRDAPPLADHISSSESHQGDHPHLDVIATAPIKAVLHLALPAAKHPAAIASAGAERVSSDLSGANRPRSPPAGPPPTIRAPPSF